MNVALSERYWDCECQVDYIHHRAVLACSICGACRDEQPNSRANEVHEHLYGKT